MLFHVPSNLQISQAIKLEAKYPLSGELLCSVQQLSGASAETLKLLARAASHRTDTEIEARRALVETRKQKVFRRFEKELLLCMALFFSGLSVEMEISYLPRPVS